MNVSLPQSLKSFIDEQITKGGYGTASEYIRQLLREEQKRQLRDEIDKRLLAALQSGDPIEVTPEYWERKRRELLQRLEAEENGS